MAVTASGLFVPSFINILSNTIAADLSSETGIKCALIDQSTATPNFDTHDYWADLSAAEVTGTNWAAGGQVLTTTTLTASPITVNSIRSGDPMFPRNTSPVFTPIPMFM